MKMRIKKFIAMGIVSFTFVACKDQSVQAPAQAQVEKQVDRVVRGNKIIDFKVERFEINSENFDNVDLKDLKEHLNKVDLNVTIDPALAGKSALYCTLSKKGLNHTVREFVIDFDTQSEGRGQARIELANGDADVKVLKCDLKNNFEDERTDYLETELYSDYVVDSEVEAANGNAIFHTMLILDNGALLVGGKLVNITAENFLTEGSISSWSKDDFRNEKYDLPGRHGGRVYINSKYAAGNLKIAFEGKNAGEITEVPAKRSDEREATEVKNNDCFMTFELMEMPKNLNEGLSGCVKGEKAVTGRQGIMGADGGNSGFIEINVQEESELRFRNSMEPRAGIGSPGGKGGEGGLGGHGQIPLIRPYGKYGEDGCRMAGDFGVSCRFLLGEYAKKLKGENGERGKDGNPGKDGLVEYSTLIVKGRKYGI